MHNYSIAKINYLAMSLFFAFTIFASCAEAKSVQLLCDAQIAKLNLGIPADNAICINAEKGTTKASEFKRNPEYVFAINAYDLDLSSSEIIDIFGDQEFTLVIDGMCAGKCSRLLMPLARRIVFTENSFAALTDNSINSRGYYMRKYAVPKIKNNTFIVSDVFKLKTDYSNKVSGEYSEDLEIMKLSAKNVTHLTWNSFLRQRLVTQINRKCSPIDSLAVILTLEYYRLNFLRVKGHYTLPPEDIIIKQVSQIMPDNAIMIYSYKNKPFSGCAD